MHRKVKTLISQLRFLPVGVLLFLAAFLAAIFMLSSGDAGPPLLAWRLLTGIACLGTLSLLVSYVGGDVALSWLVRLCRKEKQSVLELLETLGLRRSTRSSEA